MSILSGVGGSLDTKKALGGIDRFGSAATRPLSTGYIGFAAIGNITEVQGAGLVQWTVGFNTGIFFEGVSAAICGPMAFPQFSWEVWCKGLATTGIPSNATITGIRAKYVVQQDSASGGSTATWAANTLVVGGAKVGNPMIPSTQSPSYSDVLPIDSYTTYYFGSPNNMWGLTTAQLNPTSIAASDFGVSFQFFSGISGSNIVNVDYVAINIFYTVP